MNRIHQGILMRLKHHPAVGLHRRVPDRVTSSCKGIETRVQVARGHVDQGKEFLLTDSALGVIQWDWLKERSPEGKTYKRYLMAVVSG